MTEDPGLKRRTLLIAAMSTAVGLAAGQAIAADDAMTLDRARQIIGDQYKTFTLGASDRKLTALEIEELVSGNTLLGMLNDDQPFAMACNPDGTAALKVAEQTLDRGTWSIDPKKDRITTQWTTFAGGEKIVQEYYTTNMDSVFKSISLAKDRWSMFLMQKGVVSGMT